MKPTPGSGRDSPPGSNGEGSELPVLAPSTSQYAELSRPVQRIRTERPPRVLERGLVVFDLDGTLLDDIGLISTVAADVLEKSFGTPAAEARIHYLATTGMPFEAQLAQLYPNAPEPLRATTARTFHQRKVTEAYAKSEPFPEVPKLLKRLAQDGWTMAVSTGAETEMADLLLEREGLRFWFEDVLGSGEGTKREHLAEYRQRFPERPIFLVGDSRFDMEAAQSVPGVTPVARASRLPGWTLSPKDLAQWGAVWADYTLTNLPEALAHLSEGPAAPKGAKRPGSTRR
jgi:phosphoglycolate phosphatase-like HAD superfamily hydrolase